MQTSGDLVCTSTELSAGVQYCHDGFNSAQTCFFMNSHRHSPAIVPDRNHIAFFYHHIDLTGISGQGFVYAIVHDFPY